MSIWTRRTWFNQKFSDRNRRNTPLSHLLPNRWWTTLPIVPASVPSIEEFDRLDPHASLLEMFLFRCFKKNSNQEEKELPQVPTSDSASTQQNDSSYDDDGSTLVYVWPWRTYRQRNCPILTLPFHFLFRSSVQDDPEFRNLYRALSSVPSEADATANGENDSLSGFTNADRSLVSEDNTITRNYFGQSLLVGNDDDAEEDDSLLLDRLYDRKSLLPQTTTFEVILPAGKAGMVLNSTDDGGPTIHLIKDSCVVAGSVRLGDRLVEVDGQDCTRLTALEASRLLGKKSDQPERRLLFSRRVAN